MKPEIEFVESTSSGEILRKKTQSTRIAYEHQIKAMQCLDKINENHSFATMVVLPTGGGKTYTASVWLLAGAAALAGAVWQTVEFVKRMGGNVDEINIGTIV